MSIIERGALGPGFERRLRSALDSVVPPSQRLSNARYRSHASVRSRRPWRFAPALVAIGVVGVVALSAFAATGSSNPVVWTQRATSTIRSVSHIPEASPNQPQNPAPDPRGTAPVSQQSDTSHSTQTPGRKAEPDKAEVSDKPQESPHPDESPQPDHSESLPPNPNPLDSSGHDSNSSPPPGDHGGDSHRH